MYKNNEFEYDLWKTEDGHYFVRVKSDGKVSEVAREVFLFLRSQEKELYRKQELKKTGTEEVAANDSKKQKAAIEHPLSLDPMDENIDESVWEQSGEDLADLVCMKMMLADFAQTLSEIQLKVYTCILVNHETVQSFAGRTGVSNRSVFYVLKKIQEKAKDFFN